MPSRKPTLKTAAPKALAASLAAKNIAGSPSNALANSPSFSPLYEQIKTLLLQSLQRAEWKPGELIPSEQELAARFKVSQGTVRKAVDALAADNLLTRRQGKGTFVATHQEPKVQYRFLRLRASAPGDGQTQEMTREVLSCKRIRASADAARQLQLKTGDTLVQIRRVLRFGGKPVVFDDILLPGALFKGMNAGTLTAYTGPLYGLFEAEYGTRMIRADEQLRAVNSDQEISGMLSVSLGCAVLKVERLSFTYGDKPVELRTGYYLTENHFYWNAVG
jgi:GntR family transcriptional regulator